MRTLFIFLIATSFISARSQAKHYVGEKFGGGIIFSLYDDGKHGFIASLTDVEKQYFFPVSDGGVINRLGEICPCKGCVGAPYSLHDGRNNTRLLVECFDKIPNGRMYAAKACMNLNSGGFNDWYLPSIYELKALFDNLHIINKILSEDGDPNSLELAKQFGERNYVSSSLFAAFEPFSLDVYNNKIENPNNSIRVAKFSVRAIRQF